MSEVTHAIPLPAELALKCTTTLALFHPAAFGAGVIVAVTVGRIRLSWYAARLFVPFAHDNRLA